jgi:hypothetical protein
MRAYILVAGCGKPLKADLSPLFLYPYMRLLHFVRDDADGRGVRVSNPPM